MKRLRDNVAIVTGAATGIGRATSIAFAREGARVVGVDVNEDELKLTVQEIVNAGGLAEGYVLNVEDEEKIICFTRYVNEQYGRVDVLFNNAGVDAIGGKVHEYPTELFDKIMAVDLRGTFLMSKYVIPLMLQQGGSIVNVSSMSGLAADLDRSGYNAAKGGITNLTKAMAIDYGRHGIRVNSICPGTIETPLVDSLAGSKEDREGQAFRDAQTCVTPLGRIGRPEEIASVAVFLACGESSFMTGESLLVDGGVMAYTWPGKMLIDDSWKRPDK